MVSDPSSAPTSIPRESRSVFDAAQPEPSPGTRRLRAHYLLPDEPFTSYADYVAAVGANAVAKARAMGRERTLAELRASGLRGRGGAGFPTGTKWSTIHAHPCATRFVVCNAAEGEPGTFKDRHLLRYNPYATLEGMLIAAHVVGARHVYFAAKASFTRELDRLRRAVDEMGQAGVLGAVEFHVVAGPDDYLYGEEKALLEVVEGNEPLPREPHYPPYERGLFATPTSPNPALVNNVQTFAHVASIVRHGGASFREIGTADTAGTILFTVSGDIQRPGVYELPAGVSLATLFHEVAGGPLPGRQFRAALAGVSAAVIPAASFEVAADFGSLARAGSGLGSAGFVLVDDSRSMPRVAQAVARFLYLESCNQCSACKHGLGIASSALDELFVPGNADRDSVDRAIGGARSAPQGNRCFLPVQGAVVVPSLIHGYEPEYAPDRAMERAATEPWLIPVMVDFDEATRTFSYD